MISEESIAIKLTVKTEISNAMATSQNPLIGRMSGTVGNFVTSSYRGQNVVRSKAFNPKDAKTEAQQRHRSLFRMLSDEYSSLAEFIKLGFPTRPRRQSAYNAFMAVNLQNAVDKTGEFPVIDYSKMLISRGTLPKVNILTAELAEELLKLNYHSLSGLPGASENDELIVVLKTTSGAVFHSQKVRGNTEQETLQLAVPGIVSEDILYIYATVLSEDRTKVSQSVYIALT